MSREIENTVVGDDERSSRRVETETGEIPVAPSLDPGGVLGRSPIEWRLVDNRVLFVSLLAIFVAFAVGIIARLLADLIGLVTNLAYYHRLSFEFVSPASHHLGAIAILVPVVGGVIVGFMARYGSTAIRGHGIPEAMEQVLTNESRIPPRMTFLKPLSAAVAIGTGGPFGAEGPIIATGGALGSLVGQLLKTTADERKTLLAAGAAAGMTATFGTPVAAVLLAAELLLFEFRPRSIIPVALASVAATGVRYALVGSDPVFPMPHLQHAGGEAMFCYVVLGILMGIASLFVTRAVYAVEDGFEHIPIHWMWWPAFGGLVVGVVGMFAPHTLGVGYDNIVNILNIRSGSPMAQTVLFLCVMKFLSWSIALGSGTSGGTLAPIFTIGGALGAAIGGVGVALMPHAGIDVRVAALVGMAALFAGASRALLASIVFAFETTLQPMGLLPLLGGCTASYLLSCVLMRNTIMTEKIARRGIRVPSEYGADFLEQVLVREVAIRPVKTLFDDELVTDVRKWLAVDSPESHHQGFPVVDRQNALVGFVTRRDILRPDVEAGEGSGAARVADLITRAPAIIFDDNSMREVADHMVMEGVGRLPVVTRADRSKVIGIITRGDLISAHARRLEGRQQAQRTINLGLGRNG